MFIEEERLKGSAWYIAKFLTNVKAASRIKQCQASNLHSKITDFGICFQSRS